MTEMTADRETGGHAIGARDWPTIGIVVPVFGHSKLVAEAISSAVAQDYPGRIHVVVVIDGDRHEETLRTVSAFIGVADRSVSAVFRQNGRLPAARNTGIRFLLARFPDLFAVHFLDADNRLADLSIRAFVEALQQAQDAAWAYPDVTFFGLSFGASGADARITGMHYSPFRHLIGNMCEAGSMVRADVFRRGIFFDESFKFGYEDWEFWLQCLEAGLVGTRVENAGFMYRRRADSMLADADRMSDSIVARIKDKHSALFEKKAVWSRFADELRPLIVANEDATATLLSTSDRAQPADSNAIRKLVGDAYRHNFHTYLPKWVLYPLEAGAGPLEVDLPLLERLLLHAGAQAFIAGDGAVESVRNEASRWGATRFATMMFDADLPEQMRGHPLPAWIRAAAGHANAEPRQHLSRRYAGPPSFRIDRFLAEISETSGAEGELAPDVRPRRRCLVVHGSEGPGNAELLATLRRAYEVVMVDLDRLERNGAYRGTVYLGVPVSYRADTPGYELIGDIVPAFDALYVLNAFPFLFMSGQWKRSPNLVFVSEGLTPDESVAMQGFENAISRIVCSERDRRALAAAGIPAHKLESRSSHLAALDALAIADTARMVG